MIRWILAILACLLVYVVGDAVFDINPTVGEIILVLLAALAVDVIVDHR